MLDGYMRAFATNKETPALHDLISVLSQIVTNRDRAVGLGDKTAVAQLAQCRAEAEKYRKKLRPNDPFIAAGGQGASVAKMEDEVPKKVTISASLAVGMLLQKTTPVYPPVAKAAHVSGTVVLKATISKTGSVEDLNVVEGPPLLQGAAIEAVKSWRYRPYLQKNEPVEVETTVNVIFVLGG
jgi:TonB family protein